MFRALKVTALLCALLLTPSTAVFAQVKPSRTTMSGEPVQSIMWVGNSFFYYNNSMHNHVSNVIRAADPQSRPRGTSITISGAGIEWHDIES